VNNEVVVELKAVQSISDVHLTQVISYLKATGLRVGLIINFSKSKIDIKRVIQD
jgi:GxxExxY protein